MEKNVFFRTTNSPLVTHDQGCDQPNKSHTTSSSDSSQYPIAYDSLSRFLETYKRAADQSMLARKRATVRRQKEVAKQKREIEKAQTVNHLLIGPLRQASQLVFLFLSSYHSCFLNSTHIQISYLTTFIEKIFLLCTFKGERYRLQAANDRFKRFSGVLLIK